MNTQTLTGTVQRIVFSNNVTGWTVLRLSPSNDRNRPVPGRRPKNDTVTVVGTLPAPHPGETLELRGTWQTHPQYGRQFKAEYCQVARPATLEGIERYLGSSLIGGVGPVTAGRIVDHFGLQTLDILDEQPGRLAEVPGVGPKRAASIAASWAEQKAIKDVMIFLSSLGVTTGLAVKIYKTYGDDSIGVIQTNPYRLALDIRGIGFKQADRIARSQGLPLDSPERFQAGLAYALEQAANLGHVYLPQPELVAQAAELLAAPPELAHVPPGDLHRAVEALVEGYRASRETVEGGIEAVYLPPYYYAETGVAERLAGMVANETSRLAQFARIEDWEGFLAGLTGGQVKLTDQQRQAVRAALTNKVTVVTGGPGTGKTTTMQAVITALEAHKATYALAAPTGRAAKRLSQATGRQAQTIHRMLGWGREGFEYGADRPLPVDMLVVDEASMLDLLLANNLLKALRPDSHLLLVGDVDQLPSVGAGNVLRNIIDSGRVATVRLEVIFRQAAGSHIITNAHLVNRGELPVVNEGQDFFLFAQEDPTQAAARVVDVVCNRIPAKFGLDPLRDVQVLSPMRRGAAGVNALNELLQEALNPARSGKPERRFGGRVFRAGDKLMQIRNNYDKEVFNGDVGRLVGIDEEKKSLVVEIDGRMILYEWSEADELVHAYATTIHKAQGSEFPAVVIPLLTQHYMLLQRNLLYTGVTRARSLVVLVGQWKAVGMAARNDKVSRRHSGLGWRLGEDGEG